VQLDKAAMRPSSFNVNGKLIAAAKSWSLKTAMA